WEDQQFSSPTNHQTAKEPNTNLSTPSARIKAQTTNPTAASFKKKTKRNQLVYHSQKI
ncbi:hypothetical protein A2U01_0060324, partial [Trifolium medium]|nr:hypothetical protein [Trifolium medium]